MTNTGSERFIRYHLGEGIVVYLHEIATKNDVGIVVYKPVRSVVDDHGRYFVGGWVLVSSAWKVGAEISRETFETVLVLAGGREDGTH